LTIEDGGAGIIAARREYRLPDEGVHPTKPDSNRRRRGFVHEVGAASDR